MPSSLAVVRAATVPVLLALLVLLPAGAAAKPRATATPSLVAPGKPVTLRLSGFAPHSKLAVVLQPSINVGGNGFGIAVRFNTRTDRRGAALGRFTLPSGYYGCAGAYDCNRYSWPDRLSVTITISDRRSGYTSVKVRTNLHSDAASGAAPADDLQQRFRPILRFDSNERWRPLNIEQMFTTETPFACTKVGSCQPISSPDQLQGKRLLDLPGSINSPQSQASPDPKCRKGRRLDCDSGVAAGMYVNSTHSSSYTFIDYWAYYRFNHAPGKAIYYGEHESDWEGLTVAVPSDQTDRFHFAAIAAHSGIWRYLPGVLECDTPGTNCTAGGSRIIGYVADGTHATYPRSCDSRLFCLQTGAPLPEFGYNGRVDWPANHDPSTLRQIPTTAAAWTFWPGNWNSDPRRTVRSPGTQRRYKTPGVATCTTRFSPQPQSTADCAADASAAQATADEAGICDSWLGDQIAAAACSPAQLADALANGTVGDRGGLTLSAPDRNTATGTGIAQLAGGPLSAGETVTVVGSAGTDDQLQLIAADQGRLVAYRFTDLGLKQGGTATVNIADDLTATANTPTGLHHPSQTHSLPLSPPTRPRITSARRSGRRVHLTIDSNAPTVLVEVLGRSRRSRQLTLMSRTAAVRQGRAVLTAKLRPLRRRQQRLGARVTAISENGLRSPTVERTIDVRRAARGR